MSPAPKRLKGRIRFWDSQRKLGSIVAQGAFHLMDRTSAHSSTARQFRQDLQVEFLPCEKSGELIAQEISID